MLLSVISVLVAITTFKCGGSPAPSPFWGVPGPVLVYQRPIDAMVDVTNDLGVAVLQDYAYTRSNFAFSPYGVVSVLVVLYEGARGESARQIHNTLRLPWNRDITRIGFRDIHRHLRSYFSHEGYLSGLTLNKNHTSLKLEYRRVLRFYGYDIGMGPDHQFPPTTTKKPPTTPQPTATTTTTEEIVPSTTTEDIIPPTTTTQQTTTEDIIPPTTTTRRTTTEDIIPPTTTTRRTTTEDIIPPTTTTTKRPAEEDGLTVITLNIPRETTPRPVADLPDAEEPVMDQPHADEPMSTEPAADKPMTDEPAADEPMSDKPTANEPMTDEPAVDKPMSTEPAADEPMTDEPAADEPMTDEPAADEPMSEEPVTENPPPTTMPVQDEEQTIMVESTPSAILADKSGQPTEMMVKEMPDEAVQASTEAVELQQSAEETESPPQETAASTEAPKLPTEPMTDQPEESAAPTEAQTELPTMADQPEESAAPTEAQTELPTMADEPEESAPPTEAQTELPTMADQPEESAPPTEAQTELPTMGDQPEESATPTEAQTEPPVIADQSEAPTEVPQDVPGTVLPTEPDAEIIVPTEESPDISTENEATDMVSTAEMTSTEVSEESMTESMSEVVETRVKLDVPIPLAFNQSRAAGKRIKRSLGGNEPLIVFPDISLQLQNGMYDSQVARGYELYTQLPKRPFLVDGVAEELVPVMSYTAMFPFAYIQRLHAQALEFPLDDERYKLLLLLPVERRGLRQLIYDLSSCPLREIYQALRPTRVQAIIPSFMVEGFVILTPTLQQLGIWDVFDPRRADLTGMSEDPDLYVRNIEQAVTVVIRNYVKILDIQTRTMAARASLERFVVSHPFLYFVMDTDTHVSLMAGKIVDPLNSRIY